MRRRIGISWFGAVLLLALAASRASAQSVATPSGGVEVTSAHGRSWIAIPDGPLLTIRMDPNGNITAAAAPISVAHEETTPMCASVLALSAAPTNGDPVKMVAFPPPGRCSFDAAAGKLVLPVDSARRYARICNDPTKELPPLMTCTLDPGGRLNCVPAVGVKVPSIPIGDAWRRRDGWTGTVPYNGGLHVDLAYERYAPEHVKDIPSPVVKVTCDKVPCVTFANSLPDAATGKPYRAQLFTGAHAAVTITRDSAPAGLTAGTDGYLTGTPTKLGFYEFTVGFDEAYACPWNMQTLLTKGGNSHWSHTYRLSIQDGNPPVIASFTTSADTVPSAGGDLVVTVRLSDNVGVVKVLSSRLKADGTGNSAAMTRTSGSETDGTWTITWPMAANTDATPDSYTIKVWAADAANNVINATPRTVVVGGRSGQEPVRLPIPTPTRPGS